MCVCVCANAAIRYLNRKSFAFNSDSPGAGMEENRNVFESALKTVDATFQNLDSSEISLTDVSHYFDSDPTKLVQGLRTDGKMPASYVADTTTANAQVCVWVALCFSCLFFLSPPPAPQRRRPVARVKKS